MQGSFLIDLTMDNPMTDKHSITPSPELVHQWHREACRDPYHGGAFIESKVLKYIAASAARWGADQANHDIERKLQEARDEELEACLGWVSVNCPVWPDGTRPENQLRDARRPKPPSLKQQALALVNPAPGCEPFLSEKGIDILRRALERLPDD